MLKLSYIVYCAHNPTKNFIHLYNIIIRYIIMIDLIRTSYGTILMTTDVILWYRHVTLLCMKFVYVNYASQELVAWICTAKTFIMPYLTIHCTMISSKIKDQRSKAQPVAKPLSALYYTVVVVYGSYTLGYNQEYHGHLYIHGYKLFNVIVQAT